jgi:hypothetical protein
MVAKKLDDVVFPNAQPPPMATQLQNLGGVSAIVVGVFYEHNDQVGPQSCEPPRCQGGARGRDGDWPRQQIRGGV